MSDEYTAEKPPVYPVKIAQARIKQIYRCDFHALNCIHSPEFWKSRYVIVVSRNNLHRGLVIIIPISTAVTNENNKWAVPITNHFNDKKVWAVCNALTSVSTSRLLPPKMNGIPTVPQAEFDLIVDKIFELLPNKKT
jgi:uncharacterized protein YifN (PemK superfamily)